MIAMRHSIVLALALAVCVGNSIAEPQGVPKALFGITLGAKYDVGDSEKKILGNFPVQKITGSSRSWLGNGQNVYFKPKETYPAFEYKEKPEKPQDKYFPTTFRAYVLPIITESVSSMEELRNVKVLKEVMRVEWYSEAKSVSDAFYWAVDLCKIFASDIPVKPVIQEQFEKEHGFYNCTFADGDREFSVKSSGSSMVVALEHNKSISQQKEEGIENWLRRLHAKQIKPY